MKRQLFFILTTFLCSIILFPITIAQIDESGNPNISFSFRDDGDKNHCPEFTSSGSISVTYPNTIGLCVEVLYSPSEPTQATVEILLEEGNSSRLLYSQNSTYLDSAKWNRQLFTYPFLPDSSYFGSYTLVSNLFKSESDERNLIKTTRKTLEIGQPQFNSSILSCNFDFESIFQGGLAGFEVTLENNEPFTTELEIILVLNGTEITIGNIAISPLATSYQSFIADIPNDLSAGSHEFEVKIKSPLGDVLDNITGTVNVLANGQSLELHEIQISTPGHAIDSDNLIQGERFDAIIIYSNYGQTTIGNNLTIEIDGITMPVEQTSIQFERGEGNSLTVSGSIPLDLETGVNKKANLSIFDNSNLISVSKEIKVNPLIIKGSIAENLNHSLNNRELMSLEIMNTGDHPSPFRLDYKIIDVESGDLISDGSKMIEKLNSRQTKIVHLNAPENTCRVGFWSIYSELHPLEGISVPPLDVFDSYSSIQSLDLYTIDISFTNPQLSQVSIQRGESFEINTTISSSEHNCAEIRVPVRILIEPVEQSELGISGLVQEIFIPIQSGVTTVENLKFDDSSSLSSGRYLVSIISDRYVNGQRITGNQIILDEVTIVEDSPKIELQCNTLAPPTFAQRLGINCEVNNKGNAVQTIRIKSDEMNHRSNNIITLLPDRLNQVNFESIAPIEYEESTFNFELEVLDRGSWKQIIEQEFSVNIEDPCKAEKDSLLTDLTITPYPPLAGQTVSVQIGSECGNNEKEGILQIEFFDKTREISAFSPEVSLGRLKPDVHYTYLSLEWPSICSTFELRLNLVNSERESIDQNTMGPYNSCINILRPEFAIVISENENDSTEFSFDISNIGQLDSQKMSVDVYADGIRSTLVEIPKLMIEQNESFTIKMDELGFTRMPDCFELIIDSEQIISEVDETNNVIRTCSSSIQFDSTFSSEEDRDRDGLEDKIELEGWDVFIIEHREGLDCFYEEIEKERADVGRCLVKVEFEGSSINSIDTDGDGLSDRFERELRLDPTNADTDGDGYDDAFEVNDPIQDPAVVELDAPILQISASSKPNEEGGRNLFTSAYTRTFTLQDKNTDSLSVLINVSNGDSYKIHPVKIIKITEDYVEYEATFDANWVSGFTVTVNATDSFGNSMEIELEGEEGLMQHVTSELYQLGNSVFQGAGDLALSVLATPYGLAMGIGQGLNDLVSLIGALPGLIKVVFKWLFQSIWDIVDGRGDNDPILTKTWETLSGILETLQELDREEVINATKSMISDAHKASIFKASEVAYAAYLTAFLAGMIFIEVAVFALGFGAIKSLVTAAKGGGKIKAMNVFLDTSQSIAKSEFDSYAKLIKSPKKLNTVFKRAELGDEAPHIKKMWSKAIEIRNSGLKGDKAEAFLQWCDENNIDELYRTSKSKRGTFWAHKDFIANNIGTKINDVSFKGLGTEFKRGDYDNAIRSNPDEFARQSREFAEGGLEPGNLRGKRGELRTIEKYCKTIKNWKGGGELDKLCFFPDGSIVDMEVKTKRDPLDWVTGVGKPQTGENSGPREGRITQLIEYLQKFDGDNVQEYIRLACGNEPSDCINSAPDDVARLLSSTADNRRFVIEAVDNSGLDRKILQCLKTSWSSEFCQQELSDFSERLAKRNDLTIEEIANIMEGGDDIVGMYADATDVQRSLIQLYHIKNAKLSETAAVEKLEDLARDFIVNSETINADVGKTLKSNYTDSSANIFAVSLFILLISITSLLLVYLQIRAKQVSSKP